MHRHRPNEVFYNFNSSSKRPTAFRDTCVKFLLLAKCKSAAFQGIQFRALLFVKFIRGTSENII